MTKKCWICKEEKDLEEFGNNKNRPDGKQGYCKDCSRKKDKLHYQNPIRKESIRKAVMETRERNMLFLLEHLGTHSCVDCGESDPIVLDFDHVRGEKLYDVSSMASYSLETLQAEIDKCEVRCANCHRRKTARQFGYIKYKLKPV
jgi:hypothetical protein